jgi:hypothetical protein
LVSQLFSIVENAYRHGLPGLRMLSRLRYRAALSRVCAITAAILLMIAWMTPASATERISNDGGQIGTYLTKFSALRRTGQPVVIDGTCASACTLVVGMIPRNHLCVTPRAVLAFHAAWDRTLYGAQLNKPGTKYLWSHYPPGVRNWVARHGGLKSQTIYLSGRELAALFPTCH